MKSDYKNIYLVRHPKVKVPDGICYGISDISLCAQDLTEAAIKVKSKLKNTVINACYSSPLSRCFLLAEKLVDSHLITKDELLREIDFAAWEMMPWNKIPDKEQQAWGKDFINNKIHGGENFIDVQKRVVRFWEQLTPQLHKETLLVTHAGVIRALLAYLLDASTQKIFAIEVDYADVIQIKWFNENYYKVRFL
ncbi:MAG: alpha-ribazole phosphatase [Mangrovibacterium sp.]